MPIYEYRCSACGNELEALQKLSDPPLTQCPACHADALVKLVTAAGFQLKGSGWYATDFKGSGRPAAKKDSESASESKADAKETASESKSETKSESKSETKTESKTEAKGSATTPPSKSSAPSTSN
jgi:putative FmdB family regulatory protein